jgi:hypothetical protein
VDDFYKVYGYTCLYASLEHVPITDCTITFVESRRPRDLLAHFEKLRHYGVEETSPGIYTISGDILPIQIIESKRLPAGDNFWLKDLDDRLDAAELWRVAEAVERLGKAAKVAAYLDVITRANAQKMEEVLRMRGSKVTLEQVLERAGLIAEWEARGRKEGKLEGRREGKLEGRKEGRKEEKLEVAGKLLKMGIPLKKVAGATGLDTKTLGSLFPQN